MITYSGIEGKILSFVENKLLNSSTTLGLA